MRNVLLHLTTAAICILLTGCIGDAALIAGWAVIENQPGPKRLMSGSVTVNGVAVKDAVVTLTPEVLLDATDPAKYYVGVSEADGKYKLKFRWWPFCHYTLQAVYTDDQDNMYAIMIRLPLLEKDKAMFSGTSFDLPLALVKAAKTENPGP